MGLPYLPRSWGCERGVNVSISWSVWVLVTLHDFVSPGPALIASGFVPPLPKHPALSSFPSSTPARGSANIANMNPNEDDSHGKGKHIKKYNGLRLLTKHLPLSLSLCPSALSPRPIFVRRVHCLMMLIRFELLWIYFETLQCSPCYQVFCCTLLLDVVEFVAPFRLLLSAPTERPPAARGRAAKPSPRWRPRSTRRPRGPRLRRFSTRGVSRKAL